MHRFPAYAVAALAAALLVAGCGSSKKSSTASTPSTNASTTSTTAGSTSTAVQVSAVASSLGTHLAGPTGRTVYIFLNDTSAKSTCNGACAQDWPPLTTSGAPSAGSGLSASMLGTTTRADGTTQVTYNGHPLYYYSDDGRPGVKAGAMKGEGEKAWGGEWYIVGTTGNKIEKAGS